MPKSVCSSSFTGQFLHRNRGRAPRVQPGHWELLEYGEPIWKASAAWEQVSSGDRNGAIRDGRPSPPADRHTRRQRGNRVHRDRSSADNLDCMQARDFAARSQSKFLSGEGRPELIFAERGRPGPNRRRLDHTGSEHSAARLRIRSKLARASVRRSEHTNARWKELAPPGEWTGLCDC